MKFTDFTLHPDLLKGIEEAGFKECFPVQEETLKRTLEGKDVLVQSKTGTGKTAAFLITIFQHLLSNEKFKDKKALIIVPTRELATQIEDEAKLLGKYLPFKTGSFFGGMGYGKQEALLKEGVDVLIGTPGRLIDFSRQRKIDLSKVGILVIDEADRLFDMGFLPDLRKILRKMVKPEERLTMLLSATLSPRASTLAWEYMNEAEEVVIDPEQVTVDTITQSVYHVGSSEKFSLLLGILKKHAPKSAIVFTNTKHTAEEVSKRLELNGYKSKYLMGDLPQRKRLRIIQDLKENRINILVATDVAARGLHIEDLDMVVNYDVPEDPENYVHRIGRTARVGKSGVTVMLACERYVFGLEAVERFIGMKIPVETFDESLLVEDLSAGRKIERDFSRTQGRSGRHKGGTHAPLPKHGKPSSKGAKRKSSAHKGESSTHGAGKDEGKTPPKGHRRHPTKSTKSLDERLSLYRQKYGDSFAVSADKPAPNTGETAKVTLDKGKSEGENKKPGFFSRLLSLFKR